MSRSLDDLSAAFRPLVYELLAHLTERGLMVMIVDTLRTKAEHASHLAKGTSQTKLSKHLPRGLRGFAPPAVDLDKADAIDLCPYSVWQLNGADKLTWDAGDPAWQIIGEEAEKLGLRWGGRWTTLPDPGHVEA